MGRYQNILVRMLDFTLKLGITTKSLTRSHSGGCMVEGVFLTFIFIVFSCDSFSISVFLKQQEFDVEVGCSGVH